MVKVTLFDKYLGDYIELKIEEAKSYKIDEHGWLHLIDGNNIFRSFAPKTVKEIKLVK